MGSPPTDFLTEIENERRDGADERNLFRDRGDFSWIFARFSGDSQNDSADSPKIRASFRPRPKSLPSKMRQHRPLLVHLLVNSLSSIQSCSLRRGLEQIQSNLDRLSLDRFISRSFDKNCRIR